MKETPMEKAQPGVPGIHQPCVDHLDPVVPGNPLEFILEMIVRDVVVVLRRRDLDVLRAHSYTLRIKLVRERDNAIYRLSWGVGL